ncbi:MAG TPA: LysR family transcriptional regulator [Candidatus Stercorousia faecigallinarum]|mgnify:CR=1 FL=1|nr:LysR family transcriptional regulator [Candidatus Stercorousia faecigallinarum]
MELRVLKYFLAVAREGSITGAANSLHLTQPTLTRQLQDLEKELKQKLLIRGKYKVTLTPEGMILRKRAEEIVDMVEKTEAEFLSISETVSGDIYIGGGESDSMKYIAEIIKEIQNDYPDIKFHIYSGNAADVVEKLDKGLLDFGILIQPVDVLKYDHITLPEKDRWGVIMRKDSPLAKKKYIELKDLENIPLLNSRQAMRKTSSKNEFIEWFHGKLEDLNTVATFNLVYNAAVMVKAGIGFAITLDKLVDISNESELCFRPLKPKLESGLDIVWKKYQMFSPAAKLFLDKLQEKFAS